MGVPDFPPRRLTDRIAELGHGSGPWHRAELEELWGKSPANKVIQDGKAHGWLVSPFRNVFYVPELRDLSILPWLPAQRREEVLIGRLLERANVSSWCLSQWARGWGIEFGATLFVTDLSRRNERLARLRELEIHVPRRVEAASPPLAIVERNRSLAQRLKKLPFEANLILVPEVPLHLQEKHIDTIRIQPPSKPAALKAKSLLAAREASSPEDAFDFRDPLGVGIPRAASSEGSSLSYAALPHVADQAWILSLLAALALPRIGERYRDILKEMRETEDVKGTKHEFQRRRETWPAYFGRPAPISVWRTTFDSGQFPYLLVPTALWDQMVSADMGARHAVTTRAEADDAA